MITAGRGTVGCGRSASRSTLGVFVVDADARVRERLVGIMQAAGWQARAFESAEQFLADPRAAVPGCVVLDVELPGMSGLELQKVLAERPGTSVIFASASRDVRLTVRAMKSGAVNFLTKPVDRESLVAAIAEALEHSGASLSRDAEQHALRQRFAALSAREREVMRLVIEGHLNKQIANELGVAEITVKVHRGRVMRKLGATSLADLVRLGAKLGIAGDEGRRRGHARGERWQPAGAASEVMPRESGPAPRREERLESRAGVLAA
jgi:FixJ family two-component response regulator